jgi:hypothetical protein
MNRGESGVEKYVRAVHRNVYSNLVTENPAMPFVKLDTGILDSTLWIEKNQRDVFLTALLMAEPREFSESLAQIEVDSMAETGFVVPPGWYGFCAAAGAGIVRRSLTEHFAGMDALRALGNPDQESRSKAFEGRRMIRINGGYLILNFMSYRDRDYGAAERMRKLRARRKDSSVTRNSDAVTQNKHERVTLNAAVTRNDTQAEAEAEAEADKAPQSPPKKSDVKPSASPGANGEFMAATRILDELPVVDKRSLVLIVAEAVQGLTNEGGNIETAVEYILAAGREAVSAGAVINRFWFTDQKYRPQTGGLNGRSKRSPAKERVDANRRALADAAVKRGWIVPDRDFGEGAAAVAESGHNGIDGRLSGRLREDGAEILPPKDRGSI